MPTLTYQQRNAASENPAIAALAKGALTYTPGKPEFSSLAGGILGDLGTSADGWDGIFNAMADIIDADIAALSVFDTIMLGLGFVPGALDTALFSPIATEYAAFTKAGDGQLNDYDGKNGSTTTGTGTGSSSSGDSGWASKCRKIFPWGYDPASGSLDDPCNP